MTDRLPTIAVARDALQSLVDRPVDDDEIRSLYAIVVWNHVVEPGDGVAGRLIAALGAETALTEVRGGARDGIARDAAELTRKDWKDAVDRWRPRFEHVPVLHNLEAARRSAVRLLVPDDVRWPAALNDLGAHAPLCLWVRGDPRALSAPVPRVAIVGARAATRYGEHVAAEFAADLAARGVTVVSGAAYGIDGTAHRATLGAGGTTVALMAGGVERPYPAGHADLIERITASGAVVSEAPPGTPPTRWRFLQQKHSCGNYAAP